MFVRGKRLKKPISSLYLSVDSAAFCCAEGSVKPSDTHGLLQAGSLNKEPNCIAIESPLTTLFLSLHPGTAPVMLLFKTYKGYFAGYKPQEHTKQVNMSFGFPAPDKTAQETGTIPAGKQQDTEQQFFNLTPAPSLSTGCALPLPRNTYWRWRDKGSLKTPRPGLCWQRGAGDAVKGTAAVSAR